MKQFFLYLAFSVLFSVTVAGQGLIKPELTTVDTTENLSRELIPNKPMTNLMIPCKLMLSEPEIKNYTLPKFDFNQHLFNFKQDYSFYIFNPTGENNFDIPFSAYPFMHSAAIFNQAAYRISDKFLIGGNSFGGQSIFSAPLPNSGFNRFDTREASMFFLYKVSKNFKIETRVSVTDRQF